MRRIGWMVAMVALAGGPPAAADWTQWRGPSGDGTAPGRIAGPVVLETLWARDLGSGYSSVSVTDGVAVTAAALDGSDWLLAFDAASGDEIWRLRLGPTYLGRSGSDDGPSATPAVGSGTVVALAADGTLVAADLTDGRELWRRQLVEEDGGHRDLYGTSAAPLIEGDRAIVVMGAPERLIAALDLTDGSVAWAGGTGSPSHHSPIVLELAGVRQVVAPSRDRVESLALDDGRPLWTFEYEEPDFTGQVVPLGEDRILVSRWGGVNALAVGRRGERFAVEELWASRDLGNSYAVPVPLGGHLYGFRSQFLSCLDIETGERVWRSRPPGGRGLIAVGGNLYLVAKDGALVAVRATPAGYEEAGRAPLFDATHAYTPPAAVGDVLYLRNLSRLAAVRIAPGEPPSRVAAAADGAPPPGSVLARLTAQIDGSADPAAVVEAFLARHPESPIVEEGWAHFVFHGAIEDLAVRGDMTGRESDEPMHRIVGTDLYHRSYRAPADERWEYSFREFERAFADPRNPNAVPGDENRSVVAFPGWEDHRAAPARGPAGDLEQVTLTGDGEEEPELELTVYTPAGWADADGPLPLVVWFDGEGALGAGRVPAALDAHAVAGAPVVAAFLRLPPPYGWSHNRARLETALRERILPYLDERYGVSGDPAERVLIGQEWAVENVLTTALRAGFGVAAMQSPVLPAPTLERVVLPKAEAARGFRLWLDHGRFDITLPALDLTAADSAERLAERFAAIGHRVELLATPGGANWTRWGGATPALLRFVAPLPAPG